MCAASTLMALAGDDVFCFAIRRNQRVYSGERVNEQAGE
jgi:hypothetical protein